ncbi:ABC transporter permease (plasmid) [Bosea sp. F3-2]|uniref:ABC transporter permease n=1 Tax=Bosea sp. F3-2 TaxID=2599640 RepID=UPI0011EC0029|nr:ABC transporter permease [Bosea sp. F3-2]QEL27340.1 ABC transporter permease [Bosea sp. F3-2]
MSELAIQPGQPRPDFENPASAVGHIGNVEQKLGPFELIWNEVGVRRGVFILLLAAVWEIYARWLDNPLSFPPLSTTAAVFVSDLASGELPVRLWSTLQVLVLGYLTGLVIATILTSVAVSSRFGTDVLATLTAMFNPLPAIALLPLALIWFGLGIPSLVFVITHSVLWAVALNVHSGFLSVSMTQRMVGQNVGLRGLPYVMKLLIPAAFPSILAGLKIGWAFAWRTLIAAELIFGVSSSQGGLGWYIFQARTLLDTPRVFAGLLTVILVGLLIEGIIFRAIENRTVRKWGMQS